MIGPFSVLIYLDLASNDCTIGFIELTREQVKIALTSLTSIDREPALLKSRKRPRTQSRHQPSEELPTKRKSKQNVYNQTLVSAITQPETMVLAMSGLSSKQMVRDYFVLGFATIHAAPLCLETSEEIRFTF